MDYAELRAEQAQLRARGIHRGIGFASFIEVTNPSAAFYGVGGARISSQDGATLRLDATGAVFVHSGVTEQGQGAESVLAQCVATSFGVPIERVRVITGDTDNTPYGGGTWASRAAGIGGEAAWQAGKALRANVLAAAALDPAGRSEGARHPRRHRRRRRHRARAHAARRGRAHRLFPARHAAARLSGRIRGDAPLRAARLAVRLHQRRAGVLSGSRHPDRRGEAAASTGAWKIAAR